MSRRSQEAQERKRGHAPWTTAQARHALTAWKKSGLPLGTFARQRGIGVTRLRRWRDRLRGPAATPAKKVTAVQLTPATVNLPLVDLGVGADVAIRFHITGPVLEIINLREVPANWVGHMLAAVMAAHTRNDAATHSACP